MPKIIENIRRQLLDTAREQINRHGYENTTIRSVAGECGVRGWTFGAGRPFYQRVQKSAGRGNHRKTV